MLQKAGPVHLRHPEHKPLSALETIKTRRSVRKYLQLPIEFTKVANILDAGRLAPSSGNLQDWKFILIIENEKRLEIAEACLQQFWMAAAPVHIVVVAEPKKQERYYGKRGEHVYSLLNAGAAIENMLLAAHAQGLGACWVSAFEETILRRVLGLPDDVTPVGIVTLGYADEKPLAPMKFDLHNITFFHSYGNRVNDEAEIYGEYSKFVSQALQSARKWAENVLQKMKQVR